MSINMYERRIRMKTKSMEIVGPFIMALIGIGFIILGYTV